MVKTPSFKRLILRAVLRQVSPMVIRLVSVADQMPLHEFHDVFRTILAWNGDLGYIVRVDAARGASFAPDQDEGPQRGSGRPIPPLVSKIQVATTNAGARAQGGLTPDFLALSALWANLSRSEQRVAWLAGQGHRNAEIARRLNKSTLTVKKQLQSVYEKLEVAGRSRRIALLRSDSRPDLKSQQLAENVSEQAIPLMGKSFSEA